jgi:glycosyltransferase involved in cell wall biosynthesis
MPIRTSGAVQLRDLARELTRRGHTVTVVIPDSGINKGWTLDFFEGYQVVRIWVPRSRGVGKIRRAISETVMPFIMMFQFQRGALAKLSSDGVIWYSPSIFHGPFIKMLKKRNNCKGYLILRDIFPQWASDLGILKKSFSFYFFDQVAKFQYSIADTIGVQTPGNIQFVDKVCRKNTYVEVLSNWLGDPGNFQSTIRINQSPLAGRKIFVYAGNMGIAQNPMSMLRLANAFKEKSDVGFIFIGRGSEIERMKCFIRDYKLTNALIFDEIHPDEILDLYAQCDVGLVSLSMQHKTHNIPGKFLTYMQSGLPVLGNVNAGNDLADTIRKYQVGQVCETDDIEELSKAARKILSQIDDDVHFSERCRHLFDNHYSSKIAAEKILRSFLSASVV